MSATLVATSTNAPLTAREHEVARLASEGFSGKWIARKLSISPRTVERHLEATYRKLEIRTRDELVELRFGGAR